MEITEQLQIKCPFCIDYYQNKIDYEEHINLLHKDKAVLINTGGSEKCLLPSCHRLFPTLELAQHHRILAHAFGPATCSLCSFKGDTQLKLKKHYVEAHKLSDYFYKCDFCLRRFRRHNTFGQHVKTHAHQTIKRSPRSAQCPICYKSLSPSGMIYHMNVHEGRDRHVCAVCGKTVQSKMSLLRHEAMKHAPEKPHKCAACPRTYATESLLSAHAKSHEAPTLPCDVCGKKFRRTAVLKQHRLLHTDQKNCVCACGKAFKTALNLQLHMRVHQARDKEYKCEACGNLYFTRQSYTEHRKTHGEKIFECYVCGKKFSVKNRLKMHIFTHDGFRPYVCHCGAGFVEKGRLLQHQLKRHKSEENHT